MIKIIETENCEDCPFCNMDNERGRDWCNIAEIKLDSKNWEELPSDKVHEECPLKDNVHIVKIKNKL